MKKRVQLLAAVVSFFCSSELLLDASPTNQFT